MSSFDNLPDKDCYTIITWPEIQHFMQHPQFYQRSKLINDELGFAEYGSSAYFVPLDICKEIANGEI